MFYPLRQGGFCSFYLNFGLGPNAAKFYSQELNLKLILTLSTILGIDVTNIILYFVNSIYPKYINVIL